MWGEVVHYGRSRSFKVIEIGTSRRSLYAIYYCSSPYQFYAYLLSFPRYNDLLFENLHFAVFTQRSLI